MPTRNRTGAVLSLILVLFITIGGVALYQWTRDDAVPPVENIDDGNSDSSEQAEHEQVEVKIRENISVLSPIDPVLGGTFFVTEITWDGNTAIVDYEDGHIAVRGHAEYEIDENGDVEITRFEAEEL